jgi:hypothetical protein
MEGWLRRQSALGAIGATDDRAPDQAIATRIPFSQPHLRG